MSEEVGGCGKGPMSPSFHTRPKKMAVLEVWLFQHHNIDPIHKT